MIVHGRAVEDMRGSQDAAPVESAAGEDPRLASVLQLARACHYEQAHTHQVTRLALKVFDDLRDLHKLGATERFWLQAGSLLHDIGWIEGQKGHHKTAQRIILDSPLLPFNGRERQIIGCVARYHRKAVPKRKHDSYASLDAQDREVVRVLAAVLRVADSLDVMHEDRVRDLACRVGQNEIAVECAVACPLDEERKQVGRKGRLFEDVFQRKLSIQWHLAQ